MTKKDIEAEENKVPELTSFGIGVYKKEER